MGSMKAAVTALDLKERANEVFAREDFTTAKTMYTEALSLCLTSDPTLLGALHSNRSVCHYHLKDYKSALQDANKAVDARPNWSRGYLRKAVALAACGDLTGSVETAQKGLEMNPADESLIEFVEEMGKEFGEGGAEDSAISDAVDKLKAAGVKTKMPVTVLSGFLGAGKTTLLNRILREEHGKKIAVIVNDMSSVNIDAELVRHNQQQHGLSHVNEELVELSNGCVCCTLRGDLIKEASSLASMAKFDLLLIESTGVSEPMPVAATFTTKDASGATLEDYFEIDNMLTVVDAHRFVTDLKCGESLKERKMAAFEEDERSIGALLMDQIEFADTILLNKCDLVKKEAAQKLLKMVNMLNPRATVVKTVQSKIDLNEVLGTKRFDMSHAEQVPGFTTELSTPHTPETEEYGIRSMVYEAKKPFHPQRLFKAFYSTTDPTALQGKTVGQDSFLRKTLRSKGFFYLAHSLDIVLEWSTAGVSCAFAVMGQWNCSMVPRHLWAESNLEWDEKWGDRHQKIVFIGEHLDIESVKSILDACLLTDEEVEMGEEGWKEFGADKCWEIDDNEANEVMDESESESESGSEESDLEIEELEN